MFDTIQSMLSQAVMKRIEEHESVLWNTKTKYTVKFIRGKCTTEKADKWGTLIRYPPNENREHTLIVFISFIEEELNKRIESQNIEINSFSDFSREYYRIMEDYKIDNEILRAYKNFKRRKRTRKVITWKKKE